MHRAGPAAILLLASLWSTSAAAQTPIQVGIQSFPGHDNASIALIGDQMGSPINVADCNSSITFVFNGVDPTRSNLYFYRGSMCDDPSVRTSGVSHLCDATGAPPAVTNNSAMVVATVPVADLVPCSTGGVGVQTSWVLAMNMVADSADGDGQAVSFPIAYDFTPPPAVTGLMADSGGAAHLSWNPPSDNQATSYQIFIEPGTCDVSSGTDASVTLYTGDAGAPMDDAGSTDDASVTFDAGASDAGTIADAGAMPDPAATPDAGVDGGAGLGAPTATAPVGSTSANVTFPDIVPNGSTGRVAIRPVDRAGNLGPLTDFVCVQHISGSSWREVECGGSTPPAWCSGGCAATPGRSHVPAWPLALAGLGLALWIGRRRT